MKDIDVKSLLKSNNANIEEEEEKIGQRSSLETMNRSMNLDDASGNAAKDMSAAVTSLKKKKIENATGYKLAELIAHAEFFRDKMNAVEKENKMLKKAILDLLEYIKRD